MKKVSGVLALLLIANVILYSSASITTAFAAENNLNTQEEYYNNIRIQEVSPNGETIGVNVFPIGAVLVFIGGIAAGYIVDGVLIRYTGQSGGEWVAKALSFNKKKPKCSNIYFSKRTGNPICHSGSGGKF